MEIKGLIIDFSHLNAEYSYLLDETSKEVVHYINNFSKEIIEKSDSSIASLFSIITSRHSYQNKLFLYLSYLLLIKKIVDEKRPIKEIRIPERILLKPIVAFLKSKNQITKVLINETASKKQKIISYLKSLINIISIFFISYRFLLNRKTDRYKNINDKGQLILIDTFILEDSLAEQRYIDRYYTGMHGMLPGNIKTNIFYVPTILSSYKKKQLDRIFDNSNENMLYKHDFLNIKDYINSFKSMIMFKLPGKLFLFNEFNISEIVKTEFRRTRFSLSSFRAFLNYYFIRNLKNKKIDIKLFINWNENQVIDKALIRSIKDFYPNCYVKGYQGFITSTNFHFYLPPTKFEIENRVIPDEICVTGNALKDNIRRYTPNIKVSVAPAFRFLNNNKFITGVAPRGILLILPIGIEESVQIVQLFCNASILIREKVIEVNVKNHPAINISKLKNELNKIFTIPFKFVDKKLPDIVNNYSVVIGSSSSALLETVSWGTPVIIIANNKGITQNPIPKSVSHEIWRLVYTPDELAESVNYYASTTDLEREKFIVLGEKIRKDYFAPITRKEVRKFLS